MSQSDRILEYLKQGYTITPLQALTLFGTMRLGARCFELRMRGHDIRSKLICGPNKKHYAQYYLHREDKQQVFV